MEKKDTYYGYIEEIWELDYGPNFKVPLFRCQRVKLSGEGVTKDEYVMTIVDLNNLGYRDEPFVGCRSGFLHYGHVQQAKEGDKQAKG